MDNSGSNQGSKQEDAFNKKFADIADAVFPVIKPGYEPMTKVKTEDGQEHEIPFSAQPVIERIGETPLSVIASQDTGSFYSWLKHHQIEGFSIDEVLNQAYKNVFAKYQNIGIGLIEQNKHDIGKVGCILNANDMAVSLILVEQVWGKIFEQMGAEKIAFIVPSPDVFMFCDITNLKGNFYLYGNAEMYFKQSPKPITNKIFLKEKGKVIVEIPEDEFKYEI